jgi:PncC family amidohydrolase
MKGAVSKEVAIEMAVGALKNSQAQVGISITGLAGEDREESSTGKTLLGIVWISCVDVYGTEITKIKEIKGKRSAFIHKAILESLIVLLQYIRHFSRLAHKKQSRRFNKKSKGH